MLQQNHKGCVTKYTLQIEFGDCYPKATFKELSQMYKDIPVS